MIKKVLTYYAERLNEYLSAIHHQPEGMAEVGFIGNTTEEKNGKMVISLIGVEREVAGGISAPMKHTPEGYVRTVLPLMLNLNVMLAVVYDERRYAESLSVLSDTLKFIQSSPRFEVDGIGYTIEIMTLSGQDLNNVWTLLGGQYYPSVVCKIRRFILDSEEITSSGSIVSKPVVEI